jgi:ubiquitin carboxyl-terminal hydrolase 14
MYVVTFIVMTLPLNSNVLISKSLDQKIEKNSPSLGRSAIYSQKSRLTRLPTYLTVHMVRFAWRADIGKKAKIMVCIIIQSPSHTNCTSCINQRKVKFPLELDALDLATEELKARMLLTSRRLKEIEKERAERRKVRKRIKAGAAAPAATKGATSTTVGDVEMADASVESSSPPVAVAAPAVPAGIGAVMEPEGEKPKLAEGELEDENVYREKEVQELAALVDPALNADVGCSVSGLYELVGAPILLSMLRSASSFVFVGIKQLLLTRALPRTPDIISVS